MAISDIKPQTTNSLSNTLDFMVSNILSEVFTATVVQVVSVNGDRVDVIPLVKRLDNEGLAVEHSTIFDVPFVRIQGGENAVIIDPQAGDIGIAVFAMRDISTVKKTGASALPPTRRSYDIADAMYIGGLLNGTPRRFVRITDAGVEIEGVDSVTVHGAEVAVNADTQAVITSPLTTVNGNLLIMGGITWTGEATGYDGASAKFKGDVEIEGALDTSEDVTAGGISLINHVHAYSGSSGTTEKAR